MADKKPKAKKKRVKSAAAIAAAQRQEQMRASFNEADIPRPTQAERGKTGISKKTPATIALFLAWLRKGHTPKRAAEEAGVERRTAFQWRQNDPEFEKAWLAAVDEGTDAFEEEARRRAVDGIDRPVFQMGECVGHTREYSDSLLIMQMKGRRPGVYGDKVQHSGPNGGSIPVKMEIEFVDPVEKAEK